MESGFSHRLGGSDGDVAVQVVRHANIDGVDVLPLDQFSPVRFDGCVAPGIGELLGPCLIAGANGLQHRFVLEIEEVVHTAIGVRMRPTHEAVADHPEAERFALRHILFSPNK
jgi:hypothetical protein